MTQTAQSLVPAGLEIAFSPTGHVRLQAGEGAVEPALAERIRRAFERGDGAGLLHLGAVEAESVLPPALSFWREIAKLYVAGVCSGSTDVPLPAGEIDRLARAAPPMTGAEYLSPAALEPLWARMEAALRDELSRSKKSLEAWLRAQGDAWSLVGRVHFHLAETPDGGARPFAFLATYTHRLAAGKPKHLVLGKALQEYAGAKNRAALLSLLAPVKRAAERSPLVREMLDAGDLYHPLSWTPDEAHRFLLEVPVLRESGIVVRVPAWWDGRKPPRPVMQVRVGKAPSTLGAKGLVDFEASLALDGQEVSLAEWKELVESPSGLVRIKGRWVEVDREKLSQVLDRFEQVRRSGLEGQMSFAEAMRLLAGARLETDDDPLAAAVGAAPEWSKVVAGEWLGETLKRLRGPEGIADVDPGKELTGELRPYQKVGLRWLWMLAQLGLGACLADDMGLGKTIQVLALLLVLRRRRETAGPHLLVAPATLISNWLAEARRFAPSLRIRVAHPSADEPADRAASESADLVITSYGQLQRTEWLARRDWDLVILDEAQAIKNPGAKQTRAAKALLSRRRIALTGTPIENRVGDLWSIFDFLNPGLLGSAAAFSRFNRRLKDDYSPLRELVRPYILRRLKTDREIVPELPAKSEVTAWCALTKAQVVQYQEAVTWLEKELARREEGDIGRRGAVLAALTRFKQICNHPSHWLGDGAWEPAKSGKFARLAELSDTIAAKQEKVLVFTQFQEMTAPLASFLEGVFGKPGLVMHGGTALKARKERVRRFQEDEDVPFFVLSLKAGGVGLNLTAASQVIHFDRWWNPAVETQATDRAFRIGQKKSVLVHKFVCKGTVEERIDRLLEAKSGLSRGILEGGTELDLTSLPDDELLSMVSLDVEHALREGS